MILTSRHDGVMLQWTIFVKSANKPVYVYLQKAVICWISFLLKRLKTHLVRNHFVWEWINMFTFLHWIYSTQFINISNFVSNLIHYLFFKYVQYQWTNNSICWSLTVNLLFFLINESLVLSLTSSLNVEFDPQEIEPVMVHLSQLEVWS